MAQVNPIILKTLRRRKGWSQERLAEMANAYFSRVSEHCADGRGRFRTDSNSLLVPLAGIEPALLAELDFESSASTNSATGAFRTLANRRGSRSRRNIAGRDLRSTRGGAALPKHSSVILSASTGRSAQDRTLPPER